MGWVTSFSLLSNGGQFAITLGCMRKMSNDQKPNMMRAEANGYAKMLDLLTMTKGIN